VAAGALTYALLANGDSKSSSTSSTAKPAATPTPAAPSPAAAPTQSGLPAKPSPAQALALQGLRGRALLTPECRPIKGPGWVYPVGPPVRGLPGIVADIRSDLYEVFAINFTCERAAAWIHKLSALRIPIKHSGDVTVLKGPAGYYCSAWPDANGRAYAGGCQSKGGGGCATTKNAYGRPYANGRGCKVTGGNKAFGWNWNVANRRVVFAHDAAGVLHLIHVSGADTNVVFRYLNGSYELQVLNTSGIGYLNGFTWTPSPGWSVKAIKTATGAACSLTPEGKIHCTGTIRPPSCLCTGDGGVVSIKFTAAPTKKGAGYLFGGSAAQFKITKMTPVPYLIPGTPDEAQKREGV
jgi:hypothetical protein